MGPGAIFGEGLCQQEGLNGLETRRCTVCRGTVRIETIRVTVDTYTHVGLHRVSRHGED